MKFLHFLLLFFAFPLSAQTTFESPYVFEGKTLQFEIPKGFKLAEPLSNEHFKLYALDTTGLKERISPNNEEWPIPKGVFQICVPKYPFGNEGVWEADQDIVLTLADLEFFTLKEDPIQFIKDDFHFQRAKFSVEYDWLYFDQVNLTVIDFGDYFFFIGTFNESHKDSGLMTFLDDAMSKSIAIIETDKENALPDWEETLMSRQNEDDSYDGNGRYIRTRIDSDRLVFRKESLLNWNNGYTTEYLQLWDYGPLDAQIQGSVILFSAGIDSDSLTDSAVVEIIQSKFDDYVIDSLKQMGTVIGEEFTFKKYTAIGNALTTKFIKHVYTTTFEGELLIIIVKRGEYTTNLFATNYEPFVKSLYSIDTAWVGPPPPTSRQ